MEKAANKLVEGAQEDHDKVRENFSLEFLQDKLEYFNVKGDFFENQTLILNEIIHKEELKEMELSKEEQELTDELVERAKVKKNLEKFLKELKNQRKVKMNKKNYETLIRSNGFYHCPECSYKTKWNSSNLKRHINAVHQKFKPWKCSDCTTGKRIKTYHLKYISK